MSIFRLGGISNSQRHIRRCSPKSFLPTHRKPGRNHCFLHNFWYTEPKGHGYHMPLSWSKDVQEQNTYLLISTPRVCWDIPEKRLQHSFRCNVLHRRWQLPLLSGHPRWCSNPFCQGGLYTCYHTMIQCVQPRLPFSQA